MINSFFLNNKYRLIFQNISYIEFIQKKIVSYFVLEAAQTLFFFGEKKIVEYLPIKLSNSIDYLQNNKIILKVDINGISYLSYLSLILFLA